MITGAAPDLSAAARRRTLTLLFVIQFLSWGGMFCVWLYTIPLLAGGMPVNAGGGAMRLVAIYFALYALLGTALTSRVAHWADRHGAGAVHGAMLLIGGAGIAALGQWPHGTMPLIAFGAIGVGWAAMSSLPYAMASHAAPAGEGERVMRLFGWSTVAPQIVVTAVIAWFAPVLIGPRAAWVMLAGGGAMALAGVVSLLARADLTQSKEPW